jgi:small-conductance mechanosensitive channel
MSPSQKTIEAPRRLARRVSFILQRPMAETTYFPRRIILAAALMSGVLLALAVHMLGARYGLDLGRLWRSDTSEFVPAGAAVAWWLIATVAFVGGYFTATLMQSAVSGQIPQRMRQFLIAVGVLVLAGAGQAASAPSPIPTISGVLAGLAALGLGAAMAFCGAHFALRKA